MHLLTPLDKIPVDQSLLLAASTSSESDSSSTPPASVSVTTGTYVIVLFNAIFNDCSQCQVKTLMCPRLRMLLQQVMLYSLLVVVTALGCSMHMMIVIYFLQHHHLQVPILCFLWAN